jgi:hypothetical protein
MVVRVGCCPKAIATAQRQTPAARDSPVLQRDLFRKRRVITPILAAARQLPINGDLQIG